MQISVSTVVGVLVALRKESVDRNLSMGLDGRFKLWSLSARRAWIEIYVTSVFMLIWNVALRKESVDRNTTMQIVIIVVHSRSPQGERG